MIVEGVKKNRNESGFARENELEKDCTSFSFATCTEVFHHLHKYIKIQIRDQSK